MAGLMLCSPGAMLRLGRLMARQLAASPVRALFLRGPLGSGKTTLAGALARALPGGNEAETASPSFTLCNMYPTQPPVFHCDLYRCPGQPPDDMLEALERADALVIVEWADYLPPDVCPPDYLDISFKMKDKYRLLTLDGCGAGTALAQAIVSRWRTLSGAAEDAGEDA